jgi:hypothetical protein
VAQQTTKLCNGAQARGSESQTPSPAEAQTGALTAYAWNVTAVHGNTRTSSLRKHLAYRAAMPQERSQAKLGVRQSTGLPTPARMLAGTQPHKDCHHPPASTAANTLQMSKRGYGSTGENRPQSHWHKPCGVRNRAEHKQPDCRTLPIAVPSRQGRYIHTQHTLCCTRKHASRRESCRDRSPDRSLLCLTLQGEQTLHSGLDATHSNGLIDVPQQTTTVHDQQDKLNPSHH